MFDNLSTEERTSVRWTIVMAAIAIGLAVVSYRSGWFWTLAASAGALGGLAHEFAQSGGRIRFFKRFDDGVYMGSVSGMFLGVISGLLVAKGLILGNQVTVTGGGQIAYDAFFAGLSLKGVAEAVSGSPVGGEGTALSASAIAEATQALQQLEPAQPPLS